MPTLYAASPFAAATRLTLSIGQRLALFFALAVLGGCVTVPGDGGSILHLWSQHLPNRQLSLRAIVPAGKPCPLATVDGHDRPLQARVATPTPTSLPVGEAADFPVTLCELAVPTTTRAAHIAGQPVPLAAAETRRIVIVGDTGCRIKVPASGPGDPIQDCADANAWPWARIATAAAATKPDLVIHFGDYHYREYCRQPARCSALAEKGIVVGYGWPGWQADLFTPATPLLAAAPWITVRGNHENCDRGGEGWQRLLSPLPPRSCPTTVDGRLPRSVLSNNVTADAYRLDLPGLPTLIVADNAGHEDYRAAEATPEDLPWFERTLAALYQAPAGQALWLLIHKPLWYDLLAADSPANALQATVQRRPPPKLSLVFAGHQHAFQTLVFTDEGRTEPSRSGRPAQVIVGNGGTQLEIFDPASPFFTDRQPPASQERWRVTDRLYDGRPATAGIVLHRYGFLLLERDDDRPSVWRASLRDPDGQPLAACRLDDAGKDVACTPERAP